MGGIGNFLKKYTPAGMMGLYGSDDAKSRAEDVNMKPFYEDADYLDTQKFLKDYGMGLMKGEVPDYYKSIGEVGGSEFENMLKMSNRDITQSATEAAARTGRARGGYLPAATAQAVGDNETQLRYSDFLRAMQGKQTLLAGGTGITEGVRGAGLQNQGQRNEYQTNEANFGLNKGKYLDTFDAAAGAARGQAISNLIKIGAGAAGFMAGGPGGAMSAMSLASAFGGGNPAPLNSNSSDEKQAAGVSKLGGISSGIDWASIFGEKGFGK